MIQYFRKVIIYLLILMTTGIIPVAQSNDTDLWPDEKQFTHPYFFSAPVIAGEWFYFSSFSYSSEHGWLGRLNKFRFTDEGKVVDQNGISAFNCQGNILPAARSFWATEITDTRRQNEVQTMLTTQSVRRLFTSGFKNQQLQMIMLSEEQQQSVLALLGDSMHSQPRVLDYGVQHKGQDRRILLGTNTGILHLFSDNANTLDESWAFIPAEFLSQVSEQQNRQFNPRQYAIDGAITLFHDDKDQDGIIESAEGDRLWAFFGMRQGGRSYYALDLTDPDHPVLKWKIDANDANGAYKLLGETWSAPQLAYISDKDTSSAQQTPVVIVAGGYAPPVETSSGTSALTGRVIYIIDADSGKKLFSVSPEADGLTNLQVPLTDAIPADVALLDSDLDGRTDRLYVGDVGGNVWRLDMNGRFSDWRMSKLAALGHGHMADDNAESSNTRRFFGQPVLVRSLLRVNTGKDFVAEIPADWVLMGSGDRANPVSGAGNTPVQNRYFALPDRQVTPYQQNDAIPAPLGAEDLHPAYSQSSDKIPGDVFMRGWYVDLDPARQEQVFGNGYVVAGKVWFTSFAPAGNSVNGQTAIGVTRLYQIELASGSFSGATAAVSQMHDRLLENPGLAYQAATGQLWMTGINDTADSKTGCTSPVISLADALKPRQIAEYPSEY